MSGAVKHNFYNSNHIESDRQVEADYDAATLSAVVEDLKQMRKEIQHQQDTLLRDMVLLETLAHKFFGK